MVYEDLRPIELTNGLVSTQNILTKDGVKLAVKGTTITDGIIRKLHKYQIKKIRVLKNVQMVYASAQEAVEDLASSVTSMMHDVLRGKGISTQDRDKLFNVLYFCNVENFASLISYLQHIECNDGFTYDHSIVSAWIAVKLGRLLDDKSIDLKVLMQIGLLHDIGKSCIPPSILNKAGKLEVSEFELVRRHPLLGFHMLKGLVQDEIAYAVLYHHEKLNGKGYPYGIKGDEIPVYAKIIGVVDAFEALIAYRPYKKSLTPLEALKVIRNTAFKGEINYSIYEQLEISIMNSYIGDPSPSDPNRIVVGYDKGTLQLIY